VNTGGGFQPYPPDNGGRYHIRATIEGQSHYACKQRGFLGKKGILIPKITASESPEGEGNTGKSSEGKNRESK